MQYNVFVSSDTPDAAVPQEVDVDVTRDAFEKTGTLSCYTSSSTTINQVANHYAFSVDLTGLVVGDMISMTLDGSNQFTGRQTENAVNAHGLCTQFDNDGIAECG